VSRSEKTGTFPNILAAELRRTVCSETSEGERQSSEKLHGSITNTLGRKRLGHKIPDSSGKECSSTPSKSETSARSPRTDPANAGTINTNNTQEKKKMALSSTPTDTSASDANQEALEARFIALYERLMEKQVSFKEAVEPFKTDNQNAGKG
jgi:hypothetical protein